MRPTLVRAGTALAALLLLASPGLAQNLSVPKRYQPLYQALDEQVSAFDRRLPPAPPAREVRRAARLDAMGCESAGELLSASRWDAAMLELDALRKVGTQVIVLEACYPLLTPDFQDPRPLLELYANLANQVRLREMALLVDHRVLAPGNALIQVSRYYQGMTRARFLDQRAEEALALALAVQPAYLTLVADPQAAAGLSVTPRQWRQYLDRVTTGLASALGSFAPALGAGSGVWADPAYVEAFAAVPGLQYIDLRFYPGSMGGGSLLDRVQSWPERVRAIDPRKRIVLGQAWLSKANPNEPFTGVPDPNVMARASFGFWAPLDAKFLRTLAHVARVEDIELVGISRPAHLFAYLDYFDPATFRASYRVLNELTAQRTTAGMQQGSITEAGRAFGAL